MNALKIGVEVNIYSHRFTPDRWRFDAMPHLFSGTRPALSVTPDAKPPHCITVGKCTSEHHLSPEHASLHGPPYYPSPPWAVRARRAPWRRPNLMASKPGP